MGKFVITRGSNGEFHFNLKANNGQVILSSEGYLTELACLNGIESVKKNAQDLVKFDLRESTDGRDYFNLKAANGQVIGTSQMYESKTSRDNGIESVKSNAPFADIVKEEV